MINVKEQYLKPLNRMQIINSNTLSHLTVCKQMSANSFKNKVINKQRSSDLSSPVVGLHSVGRLTSGRFCWVCLGTGEFLRPQGAIPPGLNPLRGVGFIAWRLRRPKKGNTDGVEGVFGLAGHVWASALRLDPP